MRTVTASFTNAYKTYEYYIPEGDDPQVGDLIITSCSWSPDADLAGERFKAVVDDAAVAKVVAINEREKGRATKFYLGLFPVAGLRERAEANKGMLDRAKERKKAQDKLDVLLEERGKWALYAQMAASDPEAAQLFAVLKGETP